MSLLRLFRDEVQTLDSQSRKANRVIVSDGITGEIVPAGVEEAFLVTTLEVTDTAATIPSTALSNRKSIVIRNLSTTDSIFIGPTSSVIAGDAIGTNAGWDVGPNESFNVDFANAIEIYAIAEAGKTVKVKVFEAA